MIRTSEKAPLLEFLAMTPAQIHGLLACLTLTLTFSVLTPALWWVLPDRWS
jgi:hypothetical protein